MDKTHKIRRRDLAQIFFRSFVVQGSWNFRKMLALGFCYAALPICNRLYKDDPRRQIEFVRRHLEFFNIHPYFAGWCLGAVAKLEEQYYQQDWPDEKPILLFKNRLSGILSAIGDRLFWNLVKPFAGLLGVLAALIAGPFAIFLFLLLFNFPHIYYRFKGVVLGYTKGFDIVSKTSFRHYNKYFNMLAFGGAILTGTLLTYCGLQTVIANAPLNVGVIDLSVFIGAILISILLFSQQRSVPLTMITVGIVALIIGIITSFIFKM